MVVDALMQIPFLASIISAVIWVGKTLWEIFGKSLRTAFAFLKVWVPWLIYQASQRIATRLLIVGVWVVLLSAVWSAIIALVRHAVSWALPVGDIPSLGGWLFDMVWEGPCQLHFAFQRVLPALLAVQTACWSIRLIWSRVQWAMQSRTTSA